MNKIPKVLRIRVTAKDIMNGKRCSSGRCAFSLATRRQLGAIVYTFWSYIDVTSANNGPNRLYPTTKKLRRFVAAFDAGSNVKPTTFTLRRAE